METRLAVFTQKLHESRAQADTLIDQMRVVGHLPLNQRAPVHDLVEYLITAENLSEIDKSAQQVYILQALKALREALIQDVPREVLLAILDRDSLKPEPYVRPADSHVIPI